MVTPPALAGISHGTSSELGQQVVQQLIDDISARLSAEDPQVLVRLGHVDVQQPDVAATLEGIPDGRGAVVVPLLLSAGFHVNVDLEEAISDYSGHAMIAKALGPDELLIDLLAERLAEVGADPRTDTIILGAAGSSDTSAVADCAKTARLLSERLGTEVRDSYLSFASPRVHDAVEQARKDRPQARIVVASYLLAPGYFQGLLRRSGGDLTTRPLLIPSREHAPPQLVEVVIRRYRQRLQDQSVSPVAPSAGGHS